MKNRIISIAFIFGIFIIYYVFEIYGLNIPCFFKSMFYINCPACGLTRAFKCIFKFKLVQAYKYNILSIPIFIIVLISIFMLIYDFIFNKNTFLKSIQKYFNNYYIVIVLSLVISFIYNNLNM